MGIFRSFIPLLITVAATMFILPPSPPPITAAQETDTADPCNNNTLLISVCSNVSADTGYEFCCNALNDTMFHIQTNIQLITTALIVTYTAGIESQLEIRHKKIKDKTDLTCLDYYGRCVSTVSTMLDNVDTIGYDFCKKASDVRNYAMKCDSEENGTMTKYGDICSVACKYGPFTV